MEASEKRLNVFDSKAEIEKIFRGSDFSPDDLQVETKESHIYETLKKLHSDNEKTNDGYAICVRGYTQSVLEDFENYLRTKVILPEDDFELILEDCNSHHHV